MGLLPENWTVSSEQFWYNLARERRLCETVRIYGATEAEVTRKMGISEQTFYRWKKKYGGLMPSEVRKLRQFEEKNVRLRRLVAHLSLDKEMLQEVIRKKL